MKIALDAMGGDFAPEYPVEGALKYLQHDQGGNEIILLGDETAVKNRIDHFHSLKKIPLNRLHVVHTTDIVDMHDEPAKVIKKRPDSSMVRGLKMHKNNEADAFVSAGSTGAQMAASLLTLGRIKGVSRPALGSFFPSKKGPVLVIDVGANAECKPEQLMQFGLMGSLYYNYIMGMENPQIGLLNIGEEKTKGSELYIQANQLMSEKLPNFCGNVEGRDVLQGKSDIIVCDGFVGNIVLKFAESILGVITHSLKQSIGKNLLSLFGAFLIKGAFKDMKKKYNYEEYGGVPLLGVNGISIICHGSSSAVALQNAIKVAEKMSINKVNEHIEEQLQLI